MSATLKLSKRLPPNSFLFRMYCGKDVWFYQVVGDGAITGFAEVMYAPEDGSEPWRHTDFKCTQLRGSARALYEALREESDQRARRAWAECEYRMAA